MKKYYLSALLTISMLSTAVAQTFVCTPANTAFKGAPLNTYTDVTIDMVNQFADTMTLGWTVLENTLDAGWDYSVCDYVACYTTLPSSSVMSPNFGSNCFLKLSVNPMAIEATGVLKFWVFDVKTPNAGDTVTFNVTSENLGLEDANWVANALYPNPATDFITVGEEVTSVQVYSLTGDLVHQQKMEATHSMVSLKGLAKGVHLVKLLHANGSATFTKLLIEK